MSGSSVDVFVGVNPVDVEAGMAGRDSEDGGGDDGPPSSGAVCCSSCRFFSSQQVDEIGVQAVVFEKVLIISLLLVVLESTLSIIYASLSGEGETNAVLSFLPWLFACTGFFGAFRRNQTAVVIWICVQGCLLCCGVITLVILISTVAFAISDLDENADLSPNHTGYVHSRKVDLILGVINIVVTILSFVVMVVACVFGVQLNTLMAHSVHLREVEETLGLVGGNGTEYIFTDPTGLPIPYAREVVGGGGGSATGRTGTQAMVTPIAFYDPAGKPQAIAVVVDERLDPRLAPRRTGAAFAPLGGGSGKKGDYSALKGGRRPSQMSTAVSTRRPSEGGSEDNRGGGGGGGIGGNQASRGGQSDSSAGTNASASSSNSGGSASGKSSRRTGRRGSR